MSVVRLIAIPILLGGITACAYTGDGILTDRGSNVALDRYVLNLGPVDFTRPWRGEYTLAYLPSGEFTIGFRTSDTEAERLTLRAKVRLVLINEKDEVVFDVMETLPHWVWGGSPSGPLVYMRGAEKEISIGGGSVRLEQIGVQADGGWGTYFSPRWNGRYRLLCETVTPDSNAPKVTATLVAVGGGWWQ